MAAPVINIPSLVGIVQLHSRLFAFGEAALGTLGTLGTGRWFADRWAWRFW
jgi:hypothetical protein